MTGPGDAPCPLAWQATAVALRSADGGRRAILIEGAPGTGKSSLALALIDRGACLLGDDGVLLQAAAGRLVVRPHPRTRGLIEVRNLGLLDMQVCEEAPAALVLSLDPAAPRHVEAAGTVTRAGIALPLLRLWPGGAVTHIKAELALARYGLTFP